MKKFIIALLIICLIAVVVLAADIVYLHKSDMQHELAAEPAATTEPTARPTEEPTAQPTEEPTARPTEDLQQPEINKTIYLTFDDGPYKYTEKLLNILNEKGVKATFFVTAQNGDYVNLIKAEHDAGHSIGIHTASHVYKNIYSSEENFFSDFYAMQQMVFDQTGKYAKLYRFPGGSSNTISGDYSKGIISKLAEDLQNRGYTYVDWNVNSGDSEGLKTAEEVFENTVKEIENLGSADAVVLLHDIHEWAVDAVPMIIDWGKENKCTFAALSEDTPQIHFEIAN